MVIEYSGNRQDIVTNPRFHRDPLRKVRYRSVPGLADYMIVAQDSAGVKHWFRQPDGCWTRGFSRSLPVA